MLMPDASRSLANAIFAPSGDQVGDEVPARSRVIRWERPLATSMMYRSVLPARPLMYAISDGCSGSGFAAGTTSAWAASDRTDAAGAVGSTPWQATTATPPAPRSKVVKTRRHMPRRRGRSVRDAHAYIGVIGVLECLKVRPWFRGRTAFTTRELRVAGVHELSLGASAGHRRVSGRRRTPRARSTRCPPASGTV